MANNPTKQPKHYFLSSIFFSTTIAYFSRSILHFILFRLSKSNIKVQLIISPLNGSDLEEQLLPAAKR